MLDWDSDRNEICERLSGKTSVLKIVLKTRNDRFLLERWITHHLHIVGAGNIIIFDNASTHQGVLNSYEKFRDQVDVVSFSGFHNNIHYPEKFPDLYKAIEISSRYFTFLDTDEFLVSARHDHFVNDASLLDGLAAAEDIDVFPATWLNNADWSPTKFLCGQKRLYSGLAWGKPILRSGAKIGGCLNHNVQIDRSHFSARASLNFFVLHLAELFPQQRIAANINKLIARGFVAAEEAPAQICARDLSGVHDGNILQYVSEISRLLPLQDLPIVADTPLRPGCLEVMSDRSVNYFGSLEKDAMHSFLSSSHETWMNALVRL